MRKEGIFARLKAKLIGKDMKLIEKKKRVVRMTKHALIANRIELEKLFDRQIATLKDRGCPMDILKILMYQKSSVIEKALEISARKGIRINVTSRIPFLLPVIPLNYRSVYDKALMMRNNDRIGRALLYPSEIKEYKGFSVPYYIFNLNDGRNMLRRGPEYAEPRMCKRGMSGLTAAELIDFCVHTDVLRQRSLYGTSARIDSVSFPNVWLDDKGTPTFGKIIPESELGAFDYPISPVSCEERHCFFNPKIFSQHIEVINVKI